MPTTTTIGPDGVRTIIGRRSPKEEDRCQRFSIGWHCSRPATLVVTQVPLQNQRSLGVSHVCGKCLDDMVSTPNENWQVTSVVLRKLEVQTVPFSCPTCGGWHKGKLDCGA